MAAKQTPLEPIKTKYAQDYLSAAELFDKDDYEGCRQTCEYNLTDPTLPPYWILKNYLLHIAANDEWHSAEDWRKRAEHIYAATQKQCDPNSKAEQDALRQLRNGLDQVKQWQEEDRPVRRTEPEIDDLEMERLEVGIAKSNNEGTIDAQASKKPIEEDKGHGMEQDASKIEPEMTSSSSKKRDPHAKYASLNQHPSLAIRSNPSRGMNRSLRARNAAFGAGGAPQKRPSIADLRRMIDEREHPERNAQEESARKGE